MANRKKEMQINESPKNKKTKKKHSVLNLKIYTNEKE